MRIWLRIRGADTNTSFSQETVVVIKPGDLQNMNLPNGVSEFCQISKFGSFRIFIAKFKITIQCSQAEACHYIGANIDAVRHEIENVEVKIRSFHEKLDERGLGWHFFSLGQESIRADDVAVPFQSDVPEKERIESIRISLKKGIKMGDTILKCSVDVPNDQIPFCQFSGGGDLFFTVIKESAVLCTDIALLEQIEGSPQRDDELLTGSIIDLEGKKIEAKSTAALRYQLMANMIIGCTKFFIDTLYNEQSVDTETLSCYGIACTGAGTFGFMKLEINFANVTMSFHSKIPFKTYKHTATAALIDFSIAYIANRTPATAI